MDILNMTALEIADNLKSKNISTIEVVNAFLENYDKYDSQYNAFISLDREMVISQASAIQEKLNKNISTSALAGVPIAIKDNICTKGLKTTCGSKMLSDFVPFYNANVIDKLLNDDLIVFGKTNMDEFAMGSTTQTSYYGATKNPFDISKVSGGSSGGSACALALNESPIALGSDTGGSVRQPSAFCGVTGLKPTYGSVSRFGLVAYASSLEQIGPMGKNVLDVSALYSTIKGKDDRDNTSLNSPDVDFDRIKNGDVKGLKIAVVKEFLDDCVNAEIRNAVLNAVDVCKNLGCTVEEISVDFYKSLVPAYYILACGQASSNLARYDGVRYGACVNADSVNDMFEKTRTDAFGTEVKKRIMLGNFVLSAGYFDDYYKKALAVQNEIKVKVKNIFKNFDVILMPTTPSLPYDLGKFADDKLSLYLDDALNVLANITGCPSLAIPCGVAENSMPIGMQIMADNFCENTLFTLGNAYQNVTTFHLEKPKAIKGVE